MDLQNLSKKREEREQKESAKRIVGYVDDIISLLREKDLELYEIQMIPELLTRRVNTIVSNYISSKKMSEVWKTPKEIKVEDLPNTDPSS